MSGLYGPDHPTLLRLAREIEALGGETNSHENLAALDRQLAEARAELSQTESRYAEGHPDVVRLRRQVEEMEQRRQAAGSGSEQTTTEYVSNPAFIQLRAQRDATLADRSSLTRQSAAIEARIASIEARILASPHVEQQYNAIMRELDSTTTEYREVTANQMEAEIGQSLEEGRKGERFTLIDPPQAPSAPIRPDRISILLASVILSLSAGFGVIVLLEQLDHSIRGRKALAAIQGAPPIAEIPLIRTDQEITRSRRWRLLVAIGIPMAIVLAASAWHYTVMNLDVLWFVALRRLGL